MNPRLMFKAGKAGMLLFFLAFFSFSSGQTKKFFGSWVSEGTSVKLIISDAGMGKVNIVAIDQSDSEKLEVSNIHVHPDGSAIDYSLFTPSTQYRVDCELSFSGKKTLREGIYHDDWIEVFYQKEKKGKK